MSQDNPEEEDPQFLARARDLGVADIKYAYQWRKETPSPAYICYPLAPKGLTVVVVGREKSGKSTLIYALLAAIERGEDFAGNTCERSKVLMFQEEPATIIKKHAEELNLGQDVFFPITRMGNLSQILAVIKLAAEYDYKVFCVDTGSRFLGLDDENNSALVAKALRPFEDLCSTLGLTVFINLHANKSEGKKGMDIIRGSTAFGGSVSQAVTIDAAENSPQRVIRIFGRLEHEVKYTLVHDPFTHSYSVDAGETNQLTQGQPRQGRPTKLTLVGLLNILPPASQAMPVLRSKVLEVLITEHGIGRRTAEKRFAEAIEQGLIREAPGHEAGMYIRTAVEVIE